MAPHGPPHRRRRTAAAARALLSSCPAGSQSVVAPRQAAAFYPAPGSETTEVEPLPYGGDMQKAAAAKDMPAARSIMAARQANATPSQRFPVCELSPQRAKPSRRSPCRNMLLTATRGWPVQMDKEKLGALNLLSLEPRRGAPRNSK